MYESSTYCDRCKKNLGSKSWGPDADKDTLERYLDLKLYDCSYEENEDKNSKNLEINLDVCLSCGKEVHDLIIQWLNKK